MKMYYKLILLFFTTNDYNDFILILAYYVQFSILLNLLFLLLKIINQK